jgi:hypothetical protein
MPALQFQYFRLHSELLRVLIDLQPLMIQANAR